MLLLAQVLRVLWRVQVCRAPRVLVRLVRRRAFSPEAVTSVRVHRVNVELDGWQSGGGRGCDPSGDTQESMPLSCVVYAAGSRSGIL